MTPEVLGGMIFGAIIGLCCGLVPLITGMKRNQAALALGGFFACLAAGIILGVFLAIPCAALFWWLSKNAENKAKDFKQ